MQLSLFSNDELLFQCYAEMVQDDGEWLAEVQQQVVPQPVAPVWADSIVPFQRPISTMKRELQTLGIRDLRKLYTSRGLKGLKTSHATKSQLD